MIWEGIYSDCLISLSLGDTNDLIYMSAKSSSRSNNFLSDVSQSLNLIGMDSSTTKVLVLKTLYALDVLEKPRKIPLSTLESNLGSWSLIFRIKHSHPNGWKYEILGLLPPHNS